MDFGQWKKALGGLNTGALRKLAAEKDAAVSEVPGFYHIFRDRYDGVDALVESELDKLDQAPADPPAQSKVNGTLDVPPPVSFPFPAKNK